MTNKLNKATVIKKPNKFEFRYTHYGSSLIKKSSTLFPIEIRKAMVMLFVVGKEKVMPTG